MDSKCIIFGDRKLDFLLSKLGDNSKKAFLLYFLMTPNLKHKISDIYLPESIFEDKEYVTNLIDYMRKNGINVGLSINTIFLESNYCMNKLPLIKSYLKNYDIDRVHITYIFGERSVRKSPRVDEYLLQSQYNWMNVAITQRWLNKNNFKLLCELKLKLDEGNSEDYYIHMRQILWDGIDILKKYELRLNSMELMIQPFYPRIKGLRKIEIGNVANTTIRCLMECCVKEGVNIILCNCIEMGIMSFGEYLRYMKTYNRESKLKLNFAIGDEVLKEYINIWMGKTNNLKEAQIRFNNLLENYRAPDPLRLL